MKKVVLAIDSFKGCLSSIEADKTAEQGIKIVCPDCEVISLAEEDDMSFIWYIIIGIVAGFLAGKIMRGGGFGLVINLLLGILGGVLGGWVFALFGLAASGLIGSLITSTVGAILVLWIASLFSKSK